MKKILVTGAAGQLGTDLALDLYRTQPQADFLFTDIKPQPPEALRSFNYKILDVTNGDALEALLVEFKPDEIYHLAALLSGTAEKNPTFAWNLNVDAFKKMLDLCVEHLSKVKLFFPSSIAVFGPNAGKVAAQKAYLDPTSMYGVTKVTGEQLAHYYYHRFALDVRSVRFPGLISSNALPGGGTTDYSVEIYRQALERASYTCYLKEDTALPFMYISDALAAIHGIMEAQADTLSVRTSYNIHGFSATPGDFTASVKRAFEPQLQVSYEPDFRQAIAESWPADLEDKAARHDWGWKPIFDLEAVTADMLAKLAHLHHA